MRLDNDSDELSSGRLFIHGRLNDPMTGGPLYCRVLSFDAAWVKYEPIYHREDGSERLGTPRQLPIEGLLKETFGGWYQGSWPPPAILKAPRGLSVPMGVPLAETCSSWSPKATAASVDPESAREASKGAADPPDTAAAWRGTALGTLRRPLSRLDTAAAEIARPIPSPILAAHSA